LARLLRTGSCTVARRQQRIRNCAKGRRRLARLLRTGSCTVARRQQRIRNCANGRRRLARLLRTQAVTLAIGTGDLKDGDLRRKLIELRRTLIKLALEVAAHLRELLGDVAGDVAGSERRRRRRRLLGDVAGLVTGERRRRRRRLLSRPNLFAPGIIFIPPIFSYQFNSPRLQLCANVSHLFHMMP
jgi:hypothetical protein